MTKIFRDGIEYNLDPGKKVSVRTTPDGHVIESWISNGKRIYFANLFNSVYCAHGDSAAQAIGDAIWKDPARRPSLDALVVEIKPKVDTRKITVNEFRVLTGACESGCKHFLEQHNMSFGVTMTLAEFLPIGGEWALKLKAVLT